MMYQILIYKFKYVKSILRNDKETNKDATHCTKAGWLNWKIKEL